MKKKSNRRRSSGGRTNHHIHHGGGRSCSSGRRFHGPPNSSIAAEVDYWMNIVEGTSDDQDKNKELPSTNPPSSSKKAPSTLKKDPPPKTETFTKLKADENSTSTAATNETGGATVPAKTEDENTSTVVPTGSLKVFRKKLDRNSRLTMSTNVSGVKVATVEATATATVSSSLIGSIDNDSRNVAASSTPTDSGSGRHINFVDDAKDIINDDQVETISSLVETIHAAPSTTDSGRGRHINFEDDAKDIINDDQVETISSFVETIHASPSTTTDSGRGRHNVDTRDQSGCSFFMPPPSGTPPRPVGRPHYQLEPAVMVPESLLKSSTNTPQPAKQMAAKAPQMSPPPNTKPPQEQADEEDPSKDDAAFNEVSSYSTSANEMVPKAVLKSSTNTPHSAVGVPVLKSTTKTARMEKTVQIMSPDAAVYQEGDDDDDDDDGAADNGSSVGTGNVVGICAVLADDSTVGDSQTDDGDDGNERASTTKPLFFRQESTALKFTSYSTNTSFPVPGKLTSMTATNETTNETTNIITTLPSVVASRDSTTIQTASRREVFTVRSSGFRDLLKEYGEEKLLELEPNLSMKAPSEVAMTAAAATTATNETGLAIFPVAPSKKAPSANSSNSTAATATATATNETGLAIFPVAPSKKAPSANPSNSTAAAATATNETSLATLPPSNMDQLTQAMTPSSTNLATSYGALPMTPRHAAILLEDLKLEEELIDAEDKELHELAIKALESNSKAIESNSKISQSSSKIYGDYEEQVEQIKQKYRRKQEIRRRKTRVLLASLPCTPQLQPMRQANVEGLTVGGTYIDREVDSQARAQTQQEGDLAHIGNGEYDDDGTYDNRIDTATQSSNAIPSTMPSKESAQVISTDRQPTTNTVPVEPLTNSSISGDGGRALARFHAFELQCVNDEISLIINEDKELEELARVVYEHNMKIFNDAKETFKAIEENLKISNDAKEVNLKISNNAKEIFNKVIESNKKANENRRKHIATRLFALVRRVNERRRSIFLDPEE